MSFWSDRVKYLWYAKINRILPVIMKCIPKMLGANYASYNWATSRENLFYPYANNKGAEQPAHPRSLISTFVIRYSDSMIPILAKSEISRLELVAVAEQAGLSLTWSQTAKTGFLVTWLNCIQITLNCTLTGSVYFHHGRERTLIISVLHIIWYCTAGSLFYILHDIIQLVLCSTYYIISYSWFFVLHITWYHTAGSLFYI